MCKMSFKADSFASFIHFCPKIVFRLSLIGTIGFGYNAMKSIAMYLLQEHVWGCGCAPTCVVAFLCATDVQHIFGGAIGEVQFFHYKFVECNCFSAKIKEMVQLKFML